MKNLLRIGMLLCSFLLASVGWVVAEEDGGGTTGITTLEALQQAITSAKDGATITLGSNIENVEEAITISRALTLNGNGNTISGSVPEGALLEITGTGAVTIKNLTVANNTEDGGSEIYVGTDPGMSTEFPATAASFENIKLSGTSEIGIAAEYHVNISIENVQETSPHQIGIWLAGSDEQLKASLTIKGTGNKFDQCIIPIQIYDQDQATVTSEDDSFVKLPGSGDETYWTDRYNSSTKTYTISTTGRTSASYSQELALLSNCIAADAENAYQKIVLGAGDYALSSQLTINKAITLEGAVDNDGAPTTTLKRTEAWSGTNNSSKHMVDITASDVKLKNLVIDGNNKETGSTTEGSGINVYKASNVTLENVISKNNKGGGLIVNGSKVTANNFHTEDNGYGINLDNGENVTGTPTLSIDDKCSVAETSKIYGPATLLTENSVIVPEGWITTTVSDYRVWTDKVITTSGNTVFANGYRVTITASENSNKVKIFRTDYPTDFVEVASASAVVFGGSKDASVENTSITMKSGQVARIYGGGYGSENTPANVNGTAKIEVKGGNITDVLCGGGNQYAKTNAVDIDITGSETKVQCLYAGGFGSPAQYTRENSWDKVVCGAKTVNIDITDATLTEGLGCGGGQGYTYTGTSIVNITNAKLGSFYGPLSNGYADDITATVTGGEIKNMVGWLEVATINRGIVRKASFTFDGTVFETDPSNITTYSIGAIAGWAQSDTNGSDVPLVTESVSYTFKNIKNVPIFNIGDGVANANVTVTGAPVRIAKFDKGKPKKPVAGFEQYLTAFEIAAGKTWTFNNGLELTSDVTLTQTGTVVVNGTMEVATAKQAAEAILKGNAAVIDASSLTADDVLTAMGSTEASLKGGIKLKFSDKTAYTDMSSAQADLAGAEYIYWDHTKSQFVSITPSKDTPSIDEEDKPVGSTIDAGMPISASVLKGGSAKVGEKVIAGTFAWVTKGEDGKEIVAKEGTNEYDVMFTPQDQIRYASVKTKAKIENVRQYYIVEPGVCANGTVEIAGENIAHKYPKDTTLAVTAKPAAHYQFKAWRGLSETSASMSYIVTESKTLVAEFEPITHTVSFGEGITVKNGETTLGTGASVAEGTVLTVTASKVGSALTSLTCNDVAIINNQVTVDKALTIKASFKSTLLPIVTATATNGKVMLYDSKGNTIALGSEVKPNTVVTVVAVPDLGYEADALTASVTVVQNQFTMGESNVTLTQTFKKQKFTVNTSAENATITLSSTGEVDYGTAITLSAATANAGYKLLGVFVNGKEIKVNDKFTVTAATTVQAVTAPLPAIQFVDQNQEVTYNGQPQAYVPNTVPAGISGFTIKYNDSETVPTNAGTYTVKVTRAADNAYAAVDASFTFKIKKAKKNVGIPTVSQVLSSPADNQFYWIGTQVGNFCQVGYQCADPNYEVDPFLIPATTALESSLNKIKIKYPSSTRAASLRAEGTEVELTLMTIGGGTIEAYLGSTLVGSNTTLYEGQTITLVARPNAGNSSLATWTGATDKGDGTATLTLGNEAATVTATFAAKGEAPIDNQNIEGIYNGTVLAGKKITENTRSNNWRYSFVKEGVTIDNPINAGVYDIVAQRSEDEMYAMTEKTIGTLTINQAASTVTSVTATSILPNETLNQSVLSGVANVDGVFTWKNPNTQLSTTANVPVVFTPTSSNYKSVETSANVVVRSLGTAAVTPRTLQLTVTGQDMGEAVTITLDGATVVSGTSVSAGQTLKVTFAAKSGYRAKATINGSSYSSGNAYTIPDNDKNVEIKVEYFVYVAPTPDPTPDPEPEIPTVSNPVVAERTATTAAITWEKVSGATSYKLFLYAKKTDSTPLKTYEFDKDGKLKATTISFTLTGLEEGKSYYIETAAYNALGTLLVKKSVELSATPTGIESISEGSQLYTVKGAIVVAPAEPLRVAIYSVTGQTLFNDEVSYLTQVPAQAGIYVVVIQKGKERITEKVFVK